LGGFWRYSGAGEVLQPGQAAAASPPACLAARSFSALIDGNAHWELFLDIL